MKPAAPVTKSFMPAMVPDALVVAGPPGRPATCGRGRTGRRPGAGRDRGARRDGEPEDDRNLGGGCFALMSVGSTPLGHRLSPCRRRWVERGWIPGQWAGRTPARRSAADQAPLAATMRAAARVTPTRLGRWTLPRSS